MTTTTITREQFVTLAQETGHFFTVEFTKRTTGEHRLMRCRTGVKKGVKGVGMSFDPSKKDLMTVYDIEREDFRMVNLSSLTDLRMHGKSYRWDMDRDAFVEIQKGSVVSSI